MIRTLPTVTRRRPPTYVITVSAEQVYLAGKGPNSCWPAYSVLYPEANPTEVIHDPVFNQKNFRNTDANAGRVNGEAMNPPTSALKAARATLVGPGESRPLGENARLLRPLVGRGFQVRELQSRLARNGKEYHNWRLGVCLGAAASDVYP